MHAGHPPRSAESRAVARNSRLMQALDHMLAPETDMLGSRFARRVVAGLAWVMLLCVLAPSGRAQMPSEPGPRVFIASFGLSDAQGVFRYEAAQAARVLSTYYGRGGETVVLPNRQDTRIPR